MKKGDRVKLTPLGIESKLGSQNTRGTVAATPIQDKTIRVLRDGKVRPDYYSRLFWEHEHTQRILDQTHLITEKQGENESRSEQQR